MRTAPAGGFRLGQIAQVEIAIDWSLLIIFMLITVSLAVGVFPGWHPEWSSALCWLLGLIAAVLFVASVLLHELSHAWVGRAMGVDIRRITLFIFGGMAHTESEPPSWWAEFMMNIVGPLVSLLLGVAFLMLASFSADPLAFDADDPQATLAALSPLSTLLFWPGPINILLGLFNLVPGYPLDGGRVLRAVLWGITGDRIAATRWASLGGQAVAWLLIGCGLLMMVGLRIPLLGSGLINGLWLAFIGWFLNNAALLSYHQIILRDSLRDMTVQQLMQTRFMRVAPQMRVSTLADELLMPTGQRAFPVVSEGQLHGLVSLGDLRKCPRGAWSTTRVDEVMTPAHELLTLSPDQNALDALSMLARSDVNQLPVVDRHGLLGLLRREDVLTWLSLHADSQPTRTSTDLGSTDLGDFAHRHRTG